MDLQDRHFMQQVHEKRAYKLQKRKKRKRYGRTAKTSKNVVVLLVLVTCFALLLINLCIYYNATQVEMLKKKNQPIDYTDEFLHKLKKLRVFTRRQNELHHSSPFIPFTTQHGLVNLTSDYLTDLGNHTQVDSNMTIEQASRGKEILLARLKTMGIDHVDLATLQLLPTWNQVVHLYGENPIIIGEQHSCKRFQQSVPRLNASVAVAGSFNTGTHTLGMLLDANCLIPENPRTGVIWQVPWGKHVPASHRLLNKVYKQFDAKNVLPAVLSRDPYTWMQSSCRHNYALQWHHTKDHCPNLVPNDVDRKIYPFKINHIPVRAKMADTKFEWKSLAHVWTDYYQQYYHATEYPRLLLRFEDLIFHPKEVTERVCACAGGTMRRDKFMYVVESAKIGPGHGQPGTKTSLVSAMIKYGSPQNRFDGFTPEDLEYARDTIDPVLMDLFHYKQP